MKQYSYKGFKVTVKDSAGKSQKEIVSAIKDAVNQHIRDSVESILNSIDFVVFVPSHNEEKCVIDGIKSIDAINDINLFNLHNYPQYVVEELADILQDNLDRMSEYAESHEDFANAIDWHTDAPAALEKINIIREIANPDEARTEKINDSIAKLHYSKGYKQALRDAGIEIKK